MRLLESAGLALFTVVVGLVADPQNPIVKIEPRPALGPLKDRGPRETSATIRVDADLVMIPVSVTDPFDRQAMGLPKERFRLYDNGVEQAITYFGLSEAPMSVVIVFDASASMGAKLAKSRQAVEEILKTANSEDEFALIQFNERVQRLVDFTTSIDEIQAGLAATESKGRTALLDAVYFAVSTIRKARHQRRAILIVSDGGDNCSRYSITETFNMVREADAQVFAIGIGIDSDSPGRWTGDANGAALLRLISEVTGGRMFPVRRLDLLRDVAERLAMLLRNQYVLGFSPAGIANDGRYHRIQVQLQDAGDKRLVWRSGYYAPGN